MVVDRRPRAADTTRAPPSWWNRVMLRDQRDADYGAAYFASGMTVPPLSLHSLSLFTLTQPLPLQSFLPAQAWVPSAAAHSPLPLQPFAPAHFTVLSPSFLGASPAKEWPVASIPTTAAATTNPRAFLPVMEPSSSWF